MRACMLAYTFYESDNRVRRYAETLAREGWEVDAIVLRREGQPAEGLLAGVRVHRIQSRVRNERSPVSYLVKLLLFFFRSAWVVTLLHFKKRYDLIHVHSVPDFEVFATLIPRLLGAKVILDIHDIVPEFYASKFGVSQRSLTFRFLVWLERLSAAYCHHVIVANHIWRQRLVERSVRPENCTAILNYPDPAIFAGPRPADPARDAFVMCYPGTLNWHQGVDLAVRTVARLREEAPNLRLLIIGDGPDRETLKRLIRSERLEDRAILKGTVPMEQIADAMAGCDLGIVPKRKDSFGNEAFSTKILEFMAMGVPVLASSTRIDRYYFDGGAIEFFDSGNVEDMAAKILELMRDPAKRQTLRARGLDYIRRNNWDVKKDEYLNLAAALVSGQAPAMIPAPRR